MTRAEFIQKYSDAPLDDLEVAERVSRIHDDQPLVDLAMDFLNIREDFFQALDDLGFERG